MKRILVFVLVALLAFGACGCKKDSKKNTTTSDKTELNAGSEISIYSYKPDTLCPILSKNEANIRMLGNVFDSLITLSESLYPEACLAESWSVTEDGKKWTLVLRKDVFWHDGSLFGPEDVIYTVNCIKENEDSLYHYNVSNIKKITAKGDAGLEIEVSDPWANFVNLLYFPIIKDGSADAEPESYKPVGTGPYRYEDKNEGNIIYLVRNTAWWGGEAATDCITVKLLPDNNTALYAFSSGSIDMTTAEDMNWGRFVDSASASYLSMPTPIFHFVGINHSNDALDFPEVRKAISESIDREKLIEEVAMGYATASSMPIHPKWFVCGERKLEAKQNMDGAKKILSENDWEASGGTFVKTVEEESFRTEFSLIYNEENLQRESMAEIIRKNLEELGIVISVEKLPYEDYEKRISEGDYDLFIGSYIVSPDMEFSFVTGENNIFSFENDEMTKSLNALKTKYSISGIEEGYSSVMDRFDELNPVVGLFFEEQIMIYTNRLKGDIAPTYFDVYRGIENLQKEAAK